MRKILKTKWLYAFMILGVLSFVMSSCSNDDNEDSSSGKARFEVKGNFSGKLLIVYSFSTTNVGESDSNEVSTLPWSKEFNYQGQVAMGGAANSILKGKPGESIELNLILDGQVKATAKATADANGELSTPTITHTQY